MSGTATQCNINSSLSILLQNEERTQIDVLDSLAQGSTLSNVIVNNLIIAWSKINSPLYNKICCSVSGGSDSDLLIDICVRCDISHKVEYVWFDTGLEYQATKEHLEYLEKTYCIKIKKYKAIKSIPSACKEYGQPFVSKQASENIYRLQKHGFQWEDEDFITLLNRYCRIADKEKLKVLVQKAANGKKTQPWANINGVWYTGCVSALEWWCNAKYNNGRDSKFNISRNAYLKEFLMAHPPKIKVSNKCCKYAKKDVSHKLVKEMGYDLMIVGVRKAEGGVRATAYKNCFTHHDDKCDDYRPVFFYTNADKQEYVKKAGIVHSDCYVRYGLCRTGCVGCPYGRDVKAELQACEAYEPKLHKAVEKIFSKSYEYTAEFKQFQKQMKKKSGEKDYEQLSFSLELLE